MRTKVLQLMTALAVIAMPIVGLATPARADGPSNVVTWVNGLRGVVGMAPLATDALLSSVAQQWANHMASTGVLGANPNLASQAPTGWTKIAENIGDGYSLGVIETVLVAATIGHSNIFNAAFNRTGVGIATDSKGQVWLVEDFGTYPPPVPPTFVFPTSGNVIFPSPQAFSWNQLTGAQYYCLTVGSTQGGNDLVNSGMLPASQLSLTVPGLPGSQPLWARIYAYSLGAWTFTDVQFSVTGANTATFTAPSSGATNIDTTRPFTWSPVGSATYYGLTVGTTQGGHDLVSTGPLPSTQTSYSVPALPVVGKLWARIYSYIAGGWAHYSDVSFTAAPR